jgi:integrase
MAAPARFLIDASVKPKTLQRYAREAMAFHKYALAIGARPTTIRQLDDVVCDYLHNLFQERGGAGKSKASTLQSALGFFYPRSRGRLHLTSRAVRGWINLRPAVPYPPLTWELACALAVELVLQGFELYGLAVVLQFDCLLRANEVLGLRKRDVVFAGDPRFPQDAPACTIILPRTKTGLNQSVIVDDPNVVQLLRRRWMTAKDRMFPFSADQYRRRFKAATKRLGLSPRYVTHSCRHGGATRMFMRNPLNIAGVMHRGRWRRQDSCTRYVQEGRALLASLHVPRNVAKLGALYAGDIFAAFDMALAQRHK